MHIDKRGWKNSDFPSSFIVTILTMKFIVNSNSHNQKKDKGSKTWVCFK